jgi:hypothetical protein
MKSELVAVLATPSGPPSRTTIWPSSVLARLVAADARFEKVGVMKNRPASNNRMKLTRGEGGSHGSRAHSRAAGAGSVLSRRAELIRVLARP